MITVVSSVSIASLIISLATLARVTYLLGWRLGRLELKVDTIWGFLMERGKVEGLNKGLLSRSSPLEVTEPITQAFRPLMSQLRGYYESQGKFLSDLDLMMELERRFGPLLTERICLPFELTNGACLVVAAKMLRMMPSTTATAVQG